MNGGHRDKFSKLTDAQISCLRLVNQHKSSKEIALILKISHYTVDQRVARACAVLEATSRWQAARWLAEHEMSLGYEPLAYETPDIADADNPMSLLGPSSTEEEQRGSGPALHLSDTVTGFNHEATDLNLSEAGASLFSPLFFPAKWGQSNALSITNRFIAAFAILSASIIITALLVASLEGLSRLLR
jgi:DNA-binding CsgD family transcriptional regulator